MLVPRTGWYSARFVFPDRIVGEGGHRLIYDPPLRRRDNLPPVGGTIDGWRDGVAAPAHYSSRITWSISIAFAALLLKHANVESGGFHLFSAESSRGKTTAVMAAQSVHGWAHRKDLLHWDVTATGMEELAAEHCDQLLVLDEMAQLDDDVFKAASKARKASFKLASGMGRLRSVHFGKKGNLCSWRILMLSSGETSVSDIAKAAGRRRLQGDQVRLIDVPALASTKFGVFDRVPKGVRSSKELAEGIERACETHFGVASRAFVTKLAEDLDTWIRKVEKWKAKFEKLARVPDHGWERRFASRFGLAYAAARCARDMKLVPWSRDWIADANVACYRAARESLPNYDKLVAGALIDVKRRLEAGDRILDLRPGHKRKSDLSVRDAYGFIKKDQTHGKIYVLKLEAMRRWIGDRLDVYAVGSRLQELGFLVGTKSRTSTTRQVMIPGIEGRQAYFCVSARFVKKFLG
jgi:putative DNA primase/helicase